MPIQFTLPAAPYVAKAHEKIVLKSLHGAYEKIASVSDIVLIEGAGGLMVPIDENVYMVDVMREFKSVTLLVTHANLGCINDTMLNINLLESLHVEYDWCVNFRDNKENFDRTTLPFYQDKFGKVLSVQRNIAQIVDSLIINRD